MTRKEVLRAWVKALRSGKFKQGFGALNKNEEYCCLGVLQEIRYRGGDEVKKEKLGGLVYYNGSSAYLDYKIIEKLVIDYFRLAQMNDAQRKSFSEIADWIEHIYLNSND